MLGNIRPGLREAQKWEALTEYSKSLVQRNNCMIGVSKIGNSLPNICKTINEAIVAFSQGYREEKIKVYYAEV